MTINTELNINNSIINNSNLIFIDSNLDNYQSLISDLDHTELMVIDSNRDGVEQITETLANYANIESIHIISHGDSGTLQLGSTKLNADNLASYSKSIESWSNSLTEDGDLLLYASRLGEGMAGEEFITSLSQLIDADIAASDDLTGNSNLGGDWDLEINTGKIEAQTIAAQELKAIDYLLGIDNDSDVLINYEDFSNISQLKLNGDTITANDSLRLTSATKKQQGSAFYQQALAIDADTSFSTQFEFQLSGGTNGGHGFTFMLQNDLEEFDVLGVNGGGLGYRGIENSLAIEFDTYFNHQFDPNNNHISVLQDGDNRNALAVADAPFDLNSGNLLTAWIDYDGDSDVLEVYLGDSPTKPEQSLLSLDIDLTTVLGEQAFLGFSAATRGPVNNHDILNWEFAANSDLIASNQVELTTIIDYSNFADINQLALNGDAIQTNEQLQLTTTQKRQQGSAFYQQALAIDADTSFSTQFQFQIAGGTTGADGFTFMLHNDLQETNALGALGGGLGYRGIDNSIAIEFDAYLNSQFETNDNHLALLQDGDNRNPLVETDALFDLNNGDVLTAWIDYDGSNDLLEVYLADNLNKPNTSVLSYNIDLSEVVGEQAFLGFSAATGGKVNSHNLLNWEFAANSNLLPDDDSNPGVIALESSRYRVNETEGTVDVTVVRTQGSDGTVSIDFNTVESSATAGVDYIANSSTLTFADGETSKTVSISILDDDLLEETEEIGITIDNLVGDATLLAPRTATITIVDDQAELESVIDFDNFSDTNSLTFNADAAPVNNALRITPAAASQRGSVFFNQALEIFSGTSFATQFQFQLTGGTTGSDGFTFMLHNDFREVNALGGFGGSLGYSEINQNIAIEFDTAQARNRDLNDNHISVLRDGNVADALATAAVPFDLNSGEVLSAWIDYDGDRNFLEIYLSDTADKPETSLLSLDIDLPEIVGEQAFLGFSAATGGRFNNHDILNWDFATNSVLLPAESMPEGLMSETVISGLAQPTAIDWSDEDTLFIAQKGGQIRVAQNGELLATPFINLAAQVNNVGDRGLLDIAVHPDFHNGSPYVYALYSYDPPEVFQNTGLAGRDGRGNRAGRLTRITADPDTNFTTAIPGSEVVILGANGTWDNFNAFVNSTVDFDESPAGILADGSNLQDFLAVDSTTHGVGSVEFGPDGALYISNGDGTSYNQVDHRTFRVQDIDNLSGKILRIDPITGEGLADNPFYNGDKNANRSKVYQYGLRNPFRITVDSLDGKVYAGDVGWTQWEEINAAAPGANFGWPHYEGGDGTNLPTGGYQDLPEAQAFYASGEIATPALLDLNHQMTGINAIVMGTVYRGDAFPEEYQGDLFFNDLGQGIVRNVSFDEEGNILEVDNFVTGAQIVVQIVEAPDGSLYYVDLDDGLIGRWFF